MTEVAALTSGFGFVWIFPGAWSWEERGNGRAGIGLALPIGDQSGSRIGMRFTTASMCLFAAIGDNRSRGHLPVDQIFSSNLVLQNAGGGIMSQIMQTGVVSECSANSLLAKASVSKADLAAPKTTSAMCEHGTVLLGEYSRVFIRILKPCRSGGNCHLGDFERQADNSRCHQPFNHFVSFVKTPDLSARFTSQISCKISRMKKYRPMRPHK